MSLEIFGRSHNEILRGKYFFSLDVRHRIAFIAVRELTEAVV